MIGFVSWTLKQRLADSDLRNEALSLGDASGRGAKQLKADIAPLQIDGHYEIEQEMINIFQRVKRLLNNDYCYERKVKLGDLAEFQVSPGQKGISMRCIVDSNPGGRMGQCNSARGSERLIWRPDHWSKWMAAWQDSKA